MKAKIVFLDNTEIEIDYYDSKCNNSVIYFMTLESGSFSSGRMSEGELGVAWQSVKYILSTTGPSPVRKKVKKTKVSDKKERMETVIEDVKEEEVVPQ